MYNKNHKNNIKTKHDEESCSETYNSPINNAPQRMIEGNQSNKYKNVVLKKTSISDVEDRFSYYHSSSESVYEDYVCNNKIDAYNNTIDISEHTEENNIFVYKEENMFFLKRKSDMEEVGNNNDDIIYHINTIKDEKKNRIKVAIVGAGMAGLSAAYILKNNDIDVTIYEARNRIGGKFFFSTRTDKSYIGQVDLFIHRKNPLINFCLRKNIYCDNINKHLYRQYIYYKDKKIYKYELRNEFFRVIKKLRYSYEHLFNMKHINNNVKNKKKLIYTSLGEAINYEIKKMKKDNNFKYIYLQLYMYFIETYLGIDIYSVSIQYIFYNISFLDIYKNICCPLELNQIIKTLKENVHIHKNKIVNKIYSYHDHIKLSFQNQVDSKVYDYCIVTVPIGVLKDSVRFFNSKKNKRKKGTNINRNQNQNQNKNKNNNIYVKKIKKKKINKNKIMENNNTNVNNNNTNVGNTNKIIKNNEQLFFKTNTAYINNSDNISNYLLDNIELTTHEKETHNLNKKDLSYKKHENGIEKDKHISDQNSNNKNSGKSCPYHHNYSFHNITSDEQNNPCESNHTCIKKKCTHLHSHKYNLKNNHLCNYDPEKNNLKYEKRKKDDTYNQFCEKYPCNKQNNTINCNNTNDLYNILFVENKKKKKKIIINKNHKKINKQNKKINKQNKKTKKKNKKRNKKKNKKNNTTKNATKNRTKNTTKNIKNHNNNDKYTGLIEFIPKLPEWKINSIKRLGVTKNNKIIVKLKEPFFYFHQNVVLYFNNDKITHDKKKKGHFKKTKQNKSYEYDNILGDTLNVSKEDKSSKHEDNPFEFVKAEQNIKTNNQINENNVNNNNNNDNNSSCSSSIFCCNSSIFCCSSKGDEKKNQRKNINMNDSNNKDIVINNNNNNNHYNIHPFFSINNLNKKEEETCMNVSNKIKDKLYDYNENIYEEENITTSPKRSSSGIIKNDMELTHNTHIGDIPNTNIGILNCFLKQNDDNDKKKNDNKEKNNDNDEKKNDNNEKKNDNNDDNNDDSNNNNYNNSNSYNSINHLTYNFNIQNVQSFSSTKTNQTTVVTNQMCDINQENIKEIKKNNVNNVIKKNLMVPSKKWKKEITYNKQSKLITYLKNENLINKDKIFLSYNSDITIKNPFSHIIFYSSHPVIALYLKSNIVSRKKRKINNKKKKNKIIIIIIIIIMMMEIITTLVIILRITIILVLTTMEVKENPLKKCADIF
ncbi:hypothetical protein PFAG_01898 [Plasmodium falciparum Santa Lucia]|uniref:Amine oxidase domain-containing protein n=1 Tax=Plasmodium falciparum Santa Lucia TaxID=478859 RepID=W7G828_PLAFA|nr:hypothetical protein PFAG_01898 [Plasmodium falciparum Santa Lucia]